MIGSKPLTKSEIQKRYYDKHQKEIRAHRVERKEEHARYIVGWNKRNRERHQTLSEKKCGRCKQVLPVEMFTKKATEKSGLSSWCTPCKKQYDRDRIKADPLYHTFIHRFNMYGLRRSEYEALDRQQNGCCAICHKPNNQIDNRTNKPKGLHVDHNHKTNKVRGLLCHKCNSALGMVNDNENILYEMIAYLKRYK